MVKPGGLAVVELDASVALVCSFFCALDGQLFLAVADSFHAAWIYTQVLQTLAHGFRAFLTQAEVVFSTATGIGMALQHQGLGRVIAHPLRMAFNNGPVAAAHAVGVKVKIDD